VIDPKVEFLLEFIEAGAQEAWYASHPVRCQENSHVCARSFAISRCVSDRMNIGSRAHHPHTPFFSLMEQANPLVRFERRSFVCARSLTGLHK
jgi:hypothetical protein